MFYGFSPPQNYLTCLNTMSMLSTKEKVSVACILIAQMLSLKKIGGANKIFWLKESL